MMILSSIWIGIIALGIIIYVVLDGFDLGVGILSLFFVGHDRDIMISSILPVWDGNETWLVLGGAVLYGAFPLAFSILLPTLYLPILLMVVALLFRGVAFEFRLKADASRQFWDVMFALGSIVATGMQGLMLGSFIQGFNLSPSDIQNLNFPAYAWITPFSVTCGVALLFGYALLAATWLIAKTEHHLQRQCYAIAKNCLFIAAFFGVVISIWSPFIDPLISQRWFTKDHIAYLIVLPILGIIFWLLALRALYYKKEHAPFWLVIGVFLSCYIGFIVTSWPYIVPRSIPYWQAAAPEGSLKFMLVGAAIMLPILFYYTYHSYRIFRGKVTDVIKY